MELFYALINFLAVVATVAVCLNISSIALHQALELEIVQQWSTLWICFIWAGMAVAIYNVVIYPIFYDPLRKYPSVTVRLSLEFIDFSV